ncbi:MAG: ABC transporter ATP-binding protein [Firmicutes bacterium]|nr:ABC transporter ATP-binding protein [Bacillota bacterium]MDD4694568.1 ABC transporter ATP-binding protein [Bacillota bacterium]
MEQIISVSGVYKSYQKEQAIKDLNFSTKEGEIVGLLGPNGCGKTTTVRLLNGVIAAEQGKIEVFGLDPKEAGDKIRLLSGVLTESAGLYPNLSGKANLEFFYELYGVEQKERIDNLLKDFGLWEHKDKKVGSYSTGMKKRLGIAKALLHSPRLLFLDEPTNGLDPEGARDLLEYIARLNEEKGVTVLICTHILTHIETLCDRFLFMADGTVIEEGTLSQIEAKYLKEFLIEIETDITEYALSSDLREELVESNSNKLIFKVKRKEHIPDLLKALLELGPVYTSRILGRDLETMYFKIREAKK